MHLFLVYFTILGVCFTLRDQKWALAVECCLKALMTSFCCHDFHDEKILEQLVSSVCGRTYKASIIVSKFKVLLFFFTSITFYEISPLFLQILELNTRQCTVPINIHSCIADTFLVFRLIKTSILFHVFLFFRIMFTIHQNW